MSATTDSESIIKYDPENKPGISNLINIYISLTGKTTEEVEKKYKNKNYGQFKKDLARIVETQIKEIQNKYYKIIENNEIDKILDEGITFTRKIAKEKYELMKQKMGLYR